MTVVSQENFLRSATLFSYLLLELNHFSVCICFTVCVVIVALRSIYGIKKNSRLYFCGSFFCNLCFLDNLTPDYILNVSEYHIS